MGVGIDDFEIYNVRLVAPRLDVLFDRLLDVLVGDGVRREQGSDTTAVGKGGDLYGDEGFKVGCRSYAVDLKRHVACVLPTLGLEAAS